MSECSPWGLALDSDELYLLPSPHAIDSPCPDPSDPEPNPHQTSALHFPAGAFDSSVQFCNQHLTPGDHEESLDL